MEQERGSQNDQNNDGAKQEQAGVKLIWTISSTAVAVWVFLLGVGLLGLWLSDHVPPATLAQVFVESVFNLAVVIVIVVHAMMYYKQAKEANKQVQILSSQLQISGEQAATMQRQFEAANRPWLSLNAELTSGLTFSNDTAYLDVQFTIANVSDAVATDVRIEGQVVFFPIGESSFVEPFRVQSELRKTIAEQQRIPMFPTVIFPRDSDHRDNGYGFPTLPAEATKPGGFVSLILIAVIEYSGAIDPAKRYQTGILGEIKGRGGRIAIQTGRDVPHTDITLMAHIKGGSFAT
jgi:hypothetical protein